MHQAESFTLLTSLQCVRTPALRGFPFSRPVPSLAAGVLGSLTWAEATLSPGRPQAVRAAPAGRVRPSAPSGLGPACSLRPPLLDGDSGLGGAVLRWLCGRALGGSY